MSDGGRLRLPHSDTYSNPDAYPAAGRADSNAHLDPNSNPDPAACVLGLMPV